MSKVDVYRHLIPDVLLEIITYKYFRIFLASMLESKKTEFIFSLLNLKSNQTYLSNTTESIQIPVEFRMICIGRKISYDLKIEKRFILERKKKKHLPEKTFVFHVWTLGMDCWHDPTGGQSCLHIILAHWHCELVDGMFCNCSQVSQYMNSLSSESVKS